MAAPSGVRFGAYTLIGRLGEGGMCHVFRAQHPGYPEDVALKLLKEDQRKDERVLDLFVTEADLSLLLDHPNLIRTLDAGEIEGRYYIAMELIEGVNLKDAVLACERAGVPLPPDFALFFVNEMLAGLEALHNAKASSGRELGLVHRDVTPSNVFIAYDGRTVVGDFGIAHIMAHGHGDPGQAVGKLGYLSPEAVVGEGVDRRSDLFAVGVLLWELLTGKRLFSSDQKKEDEILLSIAEADVPRVRRVRPGIARGLETLLVRALAKKPRDRFQTAREMADALRDYWSCEIGHTEAVSSLLAGLLRDDSQRWKRRRTAPPGTRSSAPAPADREPSPRE